MVKRDGVSFRTRTAHGRACCFSQTRAERGRRSGRWAARWWAWLRRADPGYLPAARAYCASKWTPFNVATLFTDKQKRPRLSSLTSVLTSDRVIADPGVYTGIISRHGRK